MADIYIFLLIIFINNENNINNKNINNWISYNELYKWLVIDINKLDWQVQFRPDHVHSLFRTSICSRCQHGVHQPFATG